jgi:hypothetical protein
MTPTTQDAGIDLDSEIEALALKHIAPQFRDLFPSLDYKCGEQFDRIRAFAVELLARRTPARVGEAAPIAQPTAVLGDERAQKALAAISDRLALTYRICCGTAPKQSVGELLEVTIDMPEWKVVRAALTQQASTSAPGAPADTLTPLDYRAQGREEALAIILAEEPENPFSDYIGWGSSGAPEDEGASYWKEDKLRELLHIGDRKHDAYDRAEAAYWDALGTKEEAAREMALVERAPFYKPLSDFLAKHEAWDLMGDLKRSAASQAAPAATDQPSADWQSGYKTGYETGLGDGRAEFTNPAATSPAERASLTPTAPQAASTASNK